MRCVFDIATYTLKILCTFLKKLVISVTIKLLIKKEKTINEKRRKKNVRDAKTIFIESIFALCEAA